MSRRTNLLATLAVLSVSAPAPAAGVEQLAAATAGAHTCSLNGRAEVWCWGDNFFGQLGDLGYPRGPQAQRVSLPADVVSIALGNDHTCALRTDSSVWCWGRNDVGQLGAGDSIIRNGPRKMMIDEEVERIDGGSLLTCVLLRDTTARCAGRNDLGQLGTGGDESYSLIAVAVSGLARLTQIAAGAQHVCALDDQGAVWCWGRNDYGQLGAPTTTTCEFGQSMIWCSRTPVRVEGLPIVTQIESGNHHACARASDASLWCWGANGHGQLGAVSGIAMSYSAAPQRAAIEDVRAVVGGGAHSCAIKDDRSLWCWGANGTGQLGTGGGPGIVPLPSLIVPEVTEVVAGHNFACARRGDSSIWCWGANHSGQVGYENPGPFDYWSVPRQSHATPP